MVNRYLWTPPFTIATINYSWIRDYWENPRTWEQGWSTLCTTKTQACCLRGGEGNSSTHWPHCPLPSSWHSPTRRGLPETTVLPEGKSPGWHPAPPALWVSSWESGFWFHPTGVTGDCKLSHWESDGEGGGASSTGPWQITFVPAETNYSPNLCFAHLQSKSVVPHGQGTWQSACRSAWLRSSKEEFHQPRSLVSSLQDGRVELYSPTSCGVPLSLSQPESLENLGVVWSGPPEGTQAWEQT